MKKVYTVHKVSPSNPFLLNRDIQTDKPIYYASSIHTPNIPIFGSVSSKKSVAVQRCAERMCLTVKEYKSLQSV